MIIDFGDETTRDVHARVSSRKTRRLGADVVRVAERKLDAINFAHAVGDLAVPPGNKLEKLSGDLAGFYSIRINDQFRIIFKFEAGNASAVQIIDYH